MRKYFALIPLFFTILPPIVIPIPYTDTKYFFWAFLMAAFFGLYSIFLNIPNSLKVLSAYLFLTCFTTTCPFISQFAYIEFVICLYIYAYYRVNAPTIVFRAAGVILALNLIFLAMQALHSDKVLNFGLSTNTCAGTVGNVMQLKSLIFILVAILLQHPKCVINPIAKSYILIAMVIVPVWYVFHHHVIQNFLYARGPVWMASLQLSCKHLWLGYGMGQFKALFPALGRGSFTMEGIWNTAHNMIVQYIFEIGLIGTGIFLCFVQHVAKGAKTFQAKLGMALVAFTCFFHIPDREIQTVFPLIIFVALLTREVKVAC